MRRWMGLVVLLGSGCVANKAVPPPWFTEILPSEPAISATRYDSDGTLHMVSYDDDENVLYGQWDNEARVVRWSDPLRFIVDGSPYVPDGGLDLIRLDLAIRPGTDEVWLWVGGFAGPIQAESTEVVMQVAFPPLELPQPGRPHGGGIVFEDADTLILSTAWGSPFQVARLSVDAGLNAEAEPVTIDGEPMAGFCDADIAGGLLHMRSCRGEVSVVDLADGASHSVTSGSEGSEKVVTLATAGTADRWISRQGTGRTVCVEPRNRLGRTLSDAPGDRCEGLRASVSDRADGDVRQDGNQFVVSYVNYTTLLLDRAAPSNVQSDLTGDCGGGAGAVRLDADGRFTPSHNLGPAPDAFTDITWRYEGEVLRIDYRNPTADTAAVYADVSTEHWARRTGKTLRIVTRTLPGGDADAAGIRPLTGTYLCLR